VRVSISSSAHRRQTSTPIPGTCSGDASHASTLPVERGGKQIDLTGVDVAGLSRTFPGEQRISGRPKLYILKMVLVELRTDGYANWAVHALGNQGTDRKITCWFRRGVTGENSLNVPLAMRQTAPQSELQRRAATRYSSSLGGTPAITLPSFNGTLQRSVDPGAPSRKWECLKHLIGYLIPSAQSVVRLDPMNKPN
jgi:hypothetical protein